MPGRTATVLEYRDALLSFSETFIRAQVDSLKRFEGVLVGTRRVPGSVTRPPGESGIVLSDHVRLAAARRHAFRLWGLAPRKWLERLAATRPRLLHAHFGPDGLWSLPLARSLGVPHVTTFYGYDITVEHPDDFVTGAAQRLMFRRYLARREHLFRETDLCLAYSGFLRDRLVANGCPVEKVRLHYVGIDLNRFDAGPDAPRENIVLFVGRLVEKKGCEQLIRAMADIRAAFPDVELVFVGDGPLRGRLERLAAQLLNRYRFAGRQSPDAVRDWMRRAAVLAAPSVTARSGEAEGLPTVLLEAQAMRLPVVSTRHAGIAEAIEHGVTGFLGPEGDWRAVAESLATLLEDPSLRRRFGDAGRRRIERDFDLDRNTARLEEIYAEVIAEAEAKVSPAGKFRSAG